MRAFVFALIASISVRAFAAPEINGKWSVKSKTCDNLAVVIKPLESYRFDTGFFVQVEKLSQDETSVCRIGYIFDRIIESSSSGDAVYSEKSILRSNSSKKVCWKTVNGSPVEPPISTEINPINYPPREASVSITNGLMDLEIRGASECSGTLKYQLEKSL